MGNISKILQTRASISTNTMMYHRKPTYDEPEFRPGATDVSVD